MCLFLIFRCDNDPTAFLAKSLKQVFDEPRLSNSPLGEKSNIAPVFKRRFQFLGFNFPVTEGVWTFIAINYKWVVVFHGAYFTIV